eukprot:CAMPEP_0173174840 /NCGR_PEP_ID=MMETSP1141-20130122/3566_1 /TAXON_ID=483371 /ORGANISM="non described non described, Strain CCMP2298" /LENGTH=351 /DNA_ID=CAMNT_0014096989 /DNA_START=50 /DNA_END=1105 /DNA_ORIENTATION=-
MSAFMEPLSNCKVVSSLANVPEGAMLIGTHDGSFHCDEVLAISMLSFLPTYRPSANTFILRTRKPELLEKCDIVVDVGAVYDAPTHRYDHHQRTFTDCLTEYGFKTKLSSAGLVYRHFGKEILQELLKAGSFEGVDATRELVDVCYIKLYKDFMEHIDAIDNGVSIADTEPRYHVSTTLSARVGQFNPEWNEPQTPDVQNEQFAKALLLTGSEFLQRAEGLFKSWWPARTIVQQALEQSRSLSADGKIVIFSQACPWKDHLFELEEAGFGPVLYALYPDSGGSYRIQAVPVSPNSFDSRKKLPADWCGLRDGVLSEKCGIEGCIFIHASGFIGGHSTREGAIAMAKMAVEI